MGLFKSKLDRWQPCPLGSGKWSGAHGDGWLSIVLCSAQFQEQAQPLGTTAAPQALPHILAKASAPCASLGPAWNSVVLRACPQSSSGHFYTFSSPEYLHFEENETVGEVFKSP